MYYYDDGFKVFAAGLEAILADVPVLSEHDLTVKQRNQLKALVALETQFRKALIAHRKGPETYRQFVDHICVERGNILSARPYFRERQDVFTEFISRALKKSSATGLYKFKINWTFISWVLTSQLWLTTQVNATELRDLSEKIKAARKELLEQNLPLAISQAKQFYAATPRSHLTFMDIVQIQCQGLLLAIDKFCLPDEKGMTDEESLEAFRGFRAVAIGIMRRDRVNDYSQTMMHFFPRDRQKIYWANKMLRRFVDQVDHDMISREINSNLPKTDQTTGEEVADLLAAASTVSADFAAEPDGESVVDSAVSDESMRPDVRAESDDLHETLFESITQLTLVENKLLKLKGVKL
jgi:DNA-directed RNA polymerase specialized sigma subunit